jgi:hypothetical protein
MATHTSPRSINLTNRTKWEVIEATGTTIYINPESPKAIRVALANTPERPLPRRLRRLGSGVWGKTGLVRIGGVGVAIKTEHNPNWAAETHLGLSNLVVNVALAEGLKLYNEKSLPAHTLTPELPSPLVNGVEYHGLIVPKIIEDDSACRATQMVMAVATGKLASPDNYLPRDIYEPMFNTAMKLAGFDDPSVCCYDLHRETTPKPGNLFYSGTNSHGQEVFTKIDSYATDINLHLRFTANRN